MWKLHLPWWYVSKIKILRSSVSVLHTSFMSLSWFVHLGPAHLMLYAENGIIRTFLCLLNRREEVCTVQWGSRSQTIRGWGHWDWWGLLDFSLISVVKSVVSWLISFALIHSTGEDWQNLGDDPECRPNWRIPAGFPWVALFGGTVQSHGSAHWFWARENRQVSLPTGKNQGSTVRGLHVKCFVLSVAGSI